MRKKSFTKIASSDDAIYKEKELEKQKRLQDLIDKEEKSKKFEIKERGIFFKCFKKF